MSNFDNKSITNKGLELLSAAMAGGKLEFTRIVMGSGTYSGDIGVIESLVNQKQSLDIKSITKKGSQVILSTTLLQSAITEDFYWKEIGVYAKGADNIEVLYMYGSAIDTSFISKDMLNEKMINVGVLVSNAQNVSATIDGSLVYLSRADLEEHNTSDSAHNDIRDLIKQLQVEIENIDVSEDIEAHNTDPTAHEDIRNMVKNIDLSTVNNHTTAVGESIKTHINTKSSETNVHVTNVTNGTNTHVSNERATIVNAVNSARDNINATVRTNGSTGYVIPSTTWNVITSTVTLTADRKNPQSMKLASIYIPKDGIVRVEFSTTKLTSEVDRYEQYQATYLYLTSLSSGYSTSEAYSPVTSSTVDYYSMANNTLMTGYAPANTSGGMSHDVLPTAGFEVRMGLDAINQTYSQVKYFYLKAGVYMLWGQAYVHSSGTSTLVASVSGKLGFKEVN